MADSMYVVLKGNPVDGLKCYGVFTETDLERLKGMGGIDSDCWIREVRAPSVLVPGFTSSLDASRRPR